MGVEHEDSADINREYLFFARGVPVEHNAVHAMMYALADEALESDEPIELLRRNKSSLERCTRQLEGVIDHATKHQEMAEAIVVLVNRKHRIRVPAVSVDDTN